MKFVFLFTIFCIHLVAPFAGAWIEIIKRIVDEQPTVVAPFAGAWIEIGLDRAEIAEKLQSLPSRERGLKCGKAEWITDYVSRSLRGSVD